MTHRKVEMIPWGPRVYLRRVQRQRGEHIPAWILLRKGVGSWRRGGGIAELPGRVVAGRGGGLGVVGRDGVWVE